MLAFGDCIKAMTLLLALLLAATPSPTPNPQPTLPIDFDAFCASKNSGAYQGLVTSPALGVVVMCEKADWRFYRSAVPTKWPRFPDGPR
jgi:hypothetical protein